MTLKHWFGNSWYLSWSNKSQLQFEPALWEWGVTGVSGSQSLPGIQILITTASYRASETQKFCSCHFLWLPISILYCRGLPKCTHLIVESSTSGFFCCSWQIHWENTWFHGFTAHLLVAIQYLLRKKIAVSATSGFICWISLYWKSAQTLTSKYVGTLKRNYKCMSYKTYIV